MAWIKIYKFKIAAETCITLRTAISTGSANQRPNIPWITSYFGDLKPYCQFATANPGTVHRMFIAGDTRSNAACSAGYLPVFPLYPRDWRQFTDIQYTWDEHTNIQYYSISPQKSFTPLTLIYLNFKLLIPMKLSDQAQILRECFMYP